MEERIMRMNRLMEIGNGRNREKKIKDPIMHSFDYHNEDRERKGNEKKRKGKEKKKRKGKEKKRKGKEKGKEKGVKKLRMKRINQSLLTSILVWSPPFTIGTVFPA